MKRFIFLLILPLFSQCLFEGFGGATVGDCDDLCTVYNAPKNILMNKYGIHDKHFPDDSDRENHITPYKNHFRIESCFHTLNDSLDTINMEFTCKVLLNAITVKYEVHDLTVNPMNSDIKLQNNPTFLRNSK